MNTTRSAFDTSWTAIACRASSLFERWLRPATLVAASCVIAVGACVLIGWMTDGIEMAQLGIGGAVMVFNTALLIAATGVALIALAYQRFIVVYLFGTFVLAVASVTALQLPTDSDFGIDELFFNDSHSESPYAGVRMSINSAICFVLIGLALLAMRSPGRQSWRFFVTALLSSAAISIAVVAVFGHISGLTAAMGWRGTYGMAVPTAICITTSATVLLAWAARYQSEMNVPLSKWLPFIVGNAVIIGTFGLWHAIAFQDHLRTERAFHDHFESVLGDLEYETHHHEGVLMRMANRWTSGDGTTEANWRDDAQNYLKALQGFQALAWVDSNLDVSWIESAEPNDLAKTVVNNTVLRGAMQRARQQQVAQAIILSTGSSAETKVWLCEPVLRDGLDDGCLLAVFDFRRLVPQILRRISARGQLLKIRVDQRVLFESDGFHSRGSSKFTQTAELPFANLAWTVTDNPSTQWMADERSPLPGVILGAGLLLSLLLTLTLQLAVWASRNLQLARISEAQFRAIFVNAPLGISVVDAQGCFRQTNARMQQILGYRVDQLRGKPFAEVTHPGDLDRVWTAFEEMVTGKLASFQMELRTRGADGHSKWVLVCSAAMPTNGSDWQAIGMLTDITERKHAESRLAVQFHVTRILSEDPPINEAMRQIVQHVCVLLDWDVGEFWTFDVHDSEILRPLIIWQQEWLEASAFVLETKRFAFARGQGLPGRVWETRQATWVYDVQIDANFPRAEFAKISGLRSAFAIPIQFQDKFYGVIEFFSRGNVQPEQYILDTMSALDGQLGQFFQRKKAETRLRETLALQQAILDNADRSIVSTALDGTIQVFNRAAERMLGYSADEIIGKQTPYLFHVPEEIAIRADELSLELGRSVQPGFEVFIAKPILGDVEEREWSYVRKDHSQFPTLVSVTAFRDSNGAITGYLGIANDITEQKRIVEELRQAKQAAEDANSAKSDFLANMSHEIRTPMNGVIGMTNLVLATPLSTLQKEYLQTIKESGDALLTVINDILDFSKIEAGRMELDEADFNLPDKVAAVMQVFSLRAEEQHIRLICHIEPNVPTWVAGDANRLRQVIMNLMGNAIKFTEHGEVRLRVMADEAIGAGQCDCVLHFEVSDTGIGIPLEKQQLIFDAFSQADSSTSRRFGGTGLGLSISSRLVQLMGGRIWVESEVGLGSTFHFTACFGLPKKVENAADKGPVAASRTANLRILVAEDNSINRLVALRILELAGHQAVAAVNGQEALNALAKSTFDVVLMDVQMPIMDGFETTAQIRAGEQITGKHQPIVAMTAHAMKGDRERCLAGGMDDYVPKPIQEQDLFIAIEAAIKHSTVAMPTKSRMLSDLSFHAPPQPTLV